MNHRLLLVAIFALVCCGVLQAQSAQTLGSSRVLVIGDSWSHVDCGQLQNCFIDQEMTTLAVNGGVPGIKASTLAQASELARVQSLILAHPVIDTVQLTIGLNDFLADWYNQMSPAVERALFDQIQADVEAVVNAVCAVRPSIEVILTSYDFINFEDLRQTDPLVQLGWTWLGSPTPFDLNRAMMDMDSRKETMANGDPRITYIDFYGASQRVFGVPSLGIPPFDPSLPDETLPSPVAAMGNGGTDPIHLSTSAYFNRAALAFHGFYRPHFGYFADAPGSEEDLIMQVSVNGDTTATSVRIATPGDTIDLYYGSLFGTFADAFPLAALQLYIGSPPVGPSNFPEIHLGTGAIIIESAFDGTAPLRLGEEGRSLSGFYIPPGTAGIDMMFQGFAVTPDAANGLFATTPGIVLKIR